jgi:hypothetical protein
MLPNHVAVNCPNCGGGGCVCRDYVDRNGAMAVDVLDCSMCNDGRVFTRDSGWLAEYGERSD